ncbi:MAG: hypothetical protein LJE93_14020 [Acidobacteria bacterium]|jgi:hypothetical protein|nr:hypothetical protein [Acidobacteriota bacterium]
MAGGIRKQSEVVFDRLEQSWEKLATQKRVASTLVIVFLVGLALVEARRLPWLSPELAERLPSNHFEAILLPFTLLLLAEVISLVFAIAQSVATAVGKQLEIMSLILIRQSFKELTLFPEPIVWSTTSGEITKQVLYIISDATGALLIFGLLAVYFRLQIHQPISSDPDEQSSFVGAKKFIALVLLVSLIVIAINVAWAWISTGEEQSFFEVFYTLLIFADVLIVLISLRYSVAYPVVFRYFGFAVATVLIRLALTAPRVIDAALGVTATLFAIALTWVYNRTSGVE